MQTIWKFPLLIIERQTVSVPWNATPIHAGLDPAGAPCIWCEVESTNTDREPLEVFIVGTGNARPDRATKHLGSINHGLYIWHVYLSK